jgi:uncharacterized protein YgiM (DUF1202 family)
MKGYRKLLLFILLVTAVTAVTLLSAAAASLAYGAGTVTAASLNVRAGASTSSPVTTTLSKGTAVVILETINGSWYHVSCSGTNGYVAARYIKDVQTVKDFSASGTLDGSDIIMRSAPDISGDVIGTYAAGTVMSVIGINNGWYKVEYNGCTGYIRSDLINITAGSSPSSIKEQLAAFAQQFVGYNYVYGAASPKVGFDCSGLTSYVYNKFGYAISRTASMQYKNNGVRVSKEDLQPGDLVFFSRNGKTVSHVGLYIGDGKFVNASTSSVGVIISSLNSAYYQRVWFGAKHIID